MRRRRIACAEHDYEVNVKAVSEIEELHAKVDALAAREEELLEIKRRQVALLEKLATTFGEETR